MEWIWTPKFEFHDDYLDEEDQTEIFAHAHITRYVPPEDVIHQRYSSLKNITISQLITLNVTF